MLIIKLKCPLAISKSSQKGKKVTHAKYFTGNQMKANGRSVCGAIFFLGQKWEMENNDLFANGCLKPAEIHRIRRFVRFNVDALLPRAINSILINFV